MRVGGCGAPMQDLCTSVRDGGVRVETLMVCEGYTISVCMWCSWVAVWAYHLQKHVSECLRVGPLAGPLLEVDKQRRRDADDVVQLCQHAGQLLQQRLPCRCALKLQRLYVHLNVSLKGGFDEFERYEYVAIQLTSFIVERLLK